uniref:Uncharacterized protein n=1 Tax=Romanomermis culicivorax TaxID=13658 RepID=A0A915JPG6_ROMCU
MGQWQRSEGMGNPLDILRSVENAGFSLKDAMIKITYDDIFKPRTKTTKDWKSLEIRCKASENFKCFPSIRYLIPLSFTTAWDKTLAETETLEDGSFTLTGSATKLLKGIEPRLEIHDCEGPKKVLKVEDITEEYINSNKTMDFGRYLSKVNQID